MGMVSLDSRHERETVIGTSLPGFDGGEWREDMMVTAYSGTEKDCRESKTQVHNLSINGT